MKHNIKISSFSKNYILLKFLLELGPSINIILLLSVQLNPPESLSRDN